jgi:ATP-dependent Lhr-like helicase
MNSQELVLVNLDKPSPFAFPILVDRLRGTVSSETLEDRIRKMQVQLEK